MPEFSVPVNRLKADLLARRRKLTGLWLALGSEPATEICADAGFDFVCVDGEHAPLDQDLVRRQLAELGGVFRRERLWRLAAYRELFQVNSQLFLRTLGLLFALAFFTAQGASQGDVVVAANAVLLQFIMLTSYSLDGFAQAAEALTGRAIGRRDWNEFSAAVGAAARFSLLTTVAAMLCFTLGGTALIALLTDLPAVRETAADYLPWMILMPALAVWSYLLDGVFIGATATREMRNSVFAGLIVYLPAWWLLTGPLGLGNHGLWLAFLLFTLVRSVTLGGYYLHYRRTRWSGATPPTSRWRTPRATRRCCLRTRTGQQQVQAASVSPWYSTARS